MTIVISPSRGGGIDIGGQVFLFDGTYGDDTDGSKALWEIIPSSYPTNPADERLAGGFHIIVSGPHSFTWLPSGDSSLYEIKCQPTFWGVGSNSSAVNTWLNLGSPRIWRRGSFPCTLNITIRDVATQTTQATCTVNLQS